MSFLCFCFFSVTYFYSCYKPLPLCWAFCSSVEFFFLILLFQPIIIFSTFIPLFDFPTVLFPLQLLFNVYKSSSIIYLTLHIYSLFLFFLSFPLNIFVSFIFIVLFLNWYLALVLFPSFALVCFVLVDIIFGFFCSLGQSTVHYFCWTVLILLMGVYVYVYIQSHFFVVVINFCLYVGLLQFCGAFLFSFLFFITLIFLNVFYFFYTYSFVCLSYCSFPLAVNL